MFIDWFLFSFKIYFIFQKSPVGIIYIKKIYLFFDDF